MATYALTAAALIVAFCSLWGWYCSERTQKDRKYLRSLISHDGPWYFEDMADFRNVDYDDHLRERFYLRDPFRLYSSNLQMMVLRDKTEKARDITRDPIVHDYSRSTDEQLDRMDWVRPTNDERIGSYTPWGW